MKAILVTGLKSVLISAVITAGVHAGDLFSEFDDEFGKVENIAEPSANAGFDSFLRTAKDEFSSFSSSLEKEFDQFKTITQEETQRVKEEISDYWDDPIVGDATHWVEYSKGYEQRTIVDFENGYLYITVAGTQVDIEAKIAEVLDKNKRQAFNADTISQAVEYRSKRTINDIKTGVVTEESMLNSYLIGKNKVGAQEKASLVRILTNSAKLEKHKNKAGMNLVTINVPLSNVRYIDSSKISGSAIALLPTVKKYADKVHLDEALILAVIETESSFNPMAKSPTPAYGLMQIVPHSAGKDVTKVLFGRPRILSPSYLYSGTKNIEIGATYLNILYYRYLKGIKDARSRLYCVIAAYNTGAGNVARAFSGTKNISKALPSINNMTSEQVYRQLITNLPYDETKHYLKKVTERLSKYGASNG